MHSSENAFHFQSRVSKRSLKHNKKFIWEWCYYFIWVYDPKLWILRAFPFPSFFLSLENDVRGKKELHPCNTFWVLHGISILISCISFFTILLFFTETVAPTPNLFSHAPSLHELNPHLPSPPRATAEAAGVIFSLSSFLYFSSSFPLKLPALFLISNLTKSLPSHLSPFFFIFHISSFSFVFHYGWNPFLSLFTHVETQFLFFFSFLCICVVVSWSSWFLLLSVFGV